jgi:radical SAM-linked protein
VTSQRFRVTFRKGERVRYISHLDVLRYWERAIRRAGLPLAYSQGFTPHPKIAFASPLPLGFIGEAEVMDITLDEVIANARLRSALAGESTADLTAVEAVEISPTGPAPQAVLLWADYAVDLQDIDVATTARNVTGFLDSKSFDWTEERKEKPKTYDLRAAVARLSVADGASGCPRISMRLQADQALTARPEQLVEALFPGATAGVYARTGLVLDDPSQARDLWRRKGRFDQWP